MSNKRDEERSWRSDEEYRVGDEGPPRHTQFKPGVSGNQNGCPRGSVNLRTRVHQGLRKSIVVNKNGRPTRMPVLDVIANRLLESSMKGDLKAIQWVDQSDQEAANGFGLVPVWRSNVWCYPGASSVGSDAREGLAVHPTVKPRALLEDALLDVSDRDEIVLEPFAGSGSTLIAAEATDRVCRAIEIDGLYCDAIVRRWQEMTGGEAVLDETGETFATLEGQRLREGEV